MYRVTSHGTEGERKGRGKRRMDQDKCAKEESVARYIYIYIYIV